MQSPTAARYIVDVLLPGYVGEFQSRSAIPHKSSFKHSQFALQNVVVTSVT